MTDPRGVHAPHASRDTNRGRTTLAVIVAVLGSLLLIAGLTLLFVRVEILSGDGLRDRSLAALDDPVLRQELTTVLDRQVRGELPPEVVSRLSDADVARAVDEAVRQPVFRDAFGKAIETARDALIDNRAAEVRLPLDRIGETITPRLEAIDPRLAQRASAALQGREVSIYNRDLAAASRAVQVARTLGIVLPIIAVLCFALVLVLARRRLRALIGVGVAVAAAGVGLIILEAIGAQVSRSATSRADEDVADAIWSVFAGSLHGWGLVTVFVGGAILLAGLVGALVNDRSPAARRT